MPKNEEAIAIYCAAKNIYFIAFLQPFAGHKRPDFRLEQDMLQQRLITLAQLNGDLWLPDKYFATVGAVYRPYEQGFSVLARQYDATTHVRFRDLSGIFQSVNEAVYLDQIHYNDLGDKLIADRMATDILDLCPRR
jgi:hypothetical protein